MPDDSAPSTKYFSPASVERSIVAVAGGDDVERQAHQFEAEIERDQVGRRDQHQHAERREQDQHGIFEPLLALALGVIERHGDRGGRAEQRQDFQEPGEVVDDEAAAEGRQLAGRQQQQNDAGDDQQRDRGEVDRRAPAGRSPRRRPASAAPWRRRRARSPAAAERAWQGARCPSLPRRYLASAAVCTALSACW